MVSSQKSRLVHIGSTNLKIIEVIGVARYGWKVNQFSEKSGNKQSNEAYRRVVESRVWVNHVVNENEDRIKEGKRPKPYYGINTGFGAKAGRLGLSGDDLDWVSRNLIVSHSTGAGNFLHPEIVRAAMLIRANSLAQGYSGIRPEVINTLVKMLNSGVIPEIPEYGSVGASGDLAPLSHLALAFSKRPANKEALDKDYHDDYKEECGFAYIFQPTEAEKEELAQKLGRPVDIIFMDGVEYARVRADLALECRGIERITLKAKEGLALNNGATFSAAIAALAVYDAENIIRHTEIATALTVEAQLGFRDAFLPEIQEVRRHKGQIEVAERIMRFFENSTLVDGNRDISPRYTPPQDAYSTRVTPQVLGAIWDGLRFIQGVVTDEINAATDNPLIFYDLPDSRDYKAVSGGNFHGAPLGYAMDFLGILMTDLGSLSERRIFRLTDSNINLGLHGFLINEEKSGLTSGMMIPQCLAASLVSDCKTLAHPDSVDSIPTSGNQEDHVSMSMNAARHARTIVQNIETVVAVELLCAYLGVQFRIEDLNHWIDGTWKEVKWLQGKKDPADKLREWEEDLKRDDKDRRAEPLSRMDESVIHLKKNKLKPAPGDAVAVALEEIKESIFKEGNLPSLSEPTEFDRYLRPYVVWMTALLRVGRLVNRIYAAVGLPQPERAEESG